MCGTIVKRIATHQMSSSLSMTSVRDFVRRLRFGFTTEKHMKASSTALHVLRLSKKWCPQMKIAIFGINIRKLQYTGTYDVSVRPAPHHHKTPLTAGLLEVETTRLDYIRVFHKVSVYLDTLSTSTCASAPEDAYLCQVTLSYGRHPVPAVPLQHDSPRCGPTAASSMQCTASTARSGRVCR